MKHHVLEFISYQRFSGEPHHNIKVCLSVHPKICTFSRPPPLVWVSYLPHVCFCQPPVDPQPPSPCMLVLYNITQRQFACCRQNHCTVDLCGKGVIQLQPCCDLLKHPEKELYIRPIVKNKIIINITCFILEIKNGKDLIWRPNPLLPI